MTVPPPRKKTILQIVDPDTNQEVKVSKVPVPPNPVISAYSAPRPSSVRIPERTSRALEFVSDPADGTASISAPRHPPLEPTSRRPLSTPASVPIQNPSHETSVNPVGQLKTNITSQSVETKLESLSAKSVTVSSQASHLSSPPSGNVPLPIDAIPLQASSRLDEPQVPSMSTVPKGKAPIASPPSEGYQSPVSHSAVEEPVTLERTTASTRDPVLDGSEHLRPKSVASGLGDRADSEISDTAISSPVTSSFKGPSGSPHPDVPAFRQGRHASNKPNVSTSGELQAKRATSSDKITSTESKPVTQIADNANVEGVSNLSVNTGTGSSLDTAMPGSLATGISTVPDTAEHNTTSTLEGSNVQTPVDNVTFRVGGRQVYPKSFMWSMKDRPDPEKMLECEHVFCDVFKTDASSSNIRTENRPGRSVKTATASLSTDPRGTKTFPNYGGGGYQVIPRGGAPPGMVGGAGAGYDFDLMSARSQAPPPASKGQPPARDGDLRGTRQQGSGRNRYDGPSRTGQAGVDQFIMGNILPPVEKLQVTERGWKRNKEADSVITGKIKQVRSLLNKLTLEKFEKIFKQIVDIEIDSFELLDGVVKEIFEKTLFEPKFSGMYAELCGRLDVALSVSLQKTKIIGNDGKLVSLRRILLNNCKEEFTRFAESGNVSEQKNASESSQGTPSESEAKSENPEKRNLTQEEQKQTDRLKKEEEALRATKAKRRMLANVRFIGELYIKDLIRENIIHRSCIQKLLTLAIEKREEDVLEALCKLLSKTGSKLSTNPQAGDIIGMYFTKLAELELDYSLPARVRFMLKDLIEQKDNEWKVRREEAGAKTIAEIHKDIEKEERAKQEAQAAARDRKNRGGSGMHGRDRGSHNFSRVPPMVMASRQKSSAQVSRSDSMLQKHASRTSSRSSTSYAGVRLGPGGGPNSRSGAPTGGPLGGNPWIGGFQSLADPSVNGQSGDVRRGNPNKFPGASARRGPSKVDARNVGTPTNDNIMSPDALKQKSRGLLEEYWSVGILSEFKTCLEKEVMSVNYTPFLVEALKCIFDARVQNMEKSVVLFKELVGSPIPAKDFVAAFSHFIPQLSNLRMDNPKAPVFLCRYLTVCASTRKFDGGNGPDFGLRFAIDALLENHDLKDVSKGVIYICEELNKSLEDVIPTTEERHVVLKSAYTSFGIDLAAKMSAWNPMRGLSSLKDDLKSSGLSFLVPLLEIEMLFKDLLNSSPSRNKVEDFIKSCGATIDESFVRMMIRVSWDWLFMSPPENLKNTFVDVVVGPLLGCMNGAVPRDVQMAALLETQAFLVPNLDILPPMKNEASDKQGCVAFFALYDSKLIEAEVFLRWKEDTDQSSRIPGKEKMLIQTSSFFKQLADGEQ